MEVSGGIDQGTERYWRIASCCLGQHYKSHLEMPQVLISTACVAYDIQVIPGVVHDRVILYATLLVGDKRLRKSDKARLL